MPRSRHPEANSPQSRKGRNNRRRGQCGEREVAAILSDATGLEIKRLLGQERDGGHDIAFGPFRIECKRRKRVANLYGWLVQAAINGASEPGREGLDMAGDPIVAIRADGQKWLIVQPLSDWIKLAREEVSGTT